MCLCTITLSSKLTSFWYDHQNKIDGCITFHVTRIFQHDYQLNLSTSLSPTRWPISRQTREVVWISSYNYSRFCSTIGWKILSLVLYAHQIHIEFRIWNSNHVLWHFHRKIIWYKCMHFEKYDSVIWDFLITINLDGLWPLKD